MEKKMKRSEAVSLHNSLSALGNLSGVKFAYAMAKNSKLLKDEVESIEKARTKEFGEYEKERIELAKSHAEKDDKGEPIIKDNRYQVKDTAKFEKELLKLQDKYEMKAKEEAFNNFVEEEIELELHTIKQEDLPQEITKNQLESIIDLIQE